MINLGRLKDRITERGVLLKHIAHKTKLSKQGLHSKLAGAVEFKASELMGIREALHLTDAEFIELFEPMGGK
jgi:hypothetical protein